MAYQLTELLFLIPASYLAIEFYSVHKFFREKTPDSNSFTPPISIIKPVSGSNPGLTDALESFLTQDYPDFEVIFSISGSDKEAADAVHELSEKYRERIRIAVSDQEHGSNGKVSKLINAFPYARNNIIVISDADVIIDKNYLSHISQYFSDSKTGMVTSLYTASGAVTPADRAEAAGYLIDMIPKVLTALNLQGIRFGLGAFMAVRREAVEDIGGFESIKDFLADDYQLGFKISSNGWRIRIPRKAAGIIQVGDTFRSMMQRQIRWGRTMRICRPSGYAGSIITLHILWTVLIPLLSGLTRASIATAAGYYTLRVITAILTSKKHFSTFLSPATVLLRDILTLTVWISSWLSNTVTWRENKYRITDSGEMIKLSENKPKKSV